VGASSENGSRSHFLCPHTKRNGYQKINVSIRPTHT
jgi:hypothetical protein